MMQRDYILRLIEQLGQVIAHVAGLKQRGRPEEAEQLIDQTLRQVTGLSLEEVDQLAAEQLTALLQLLRTDDPNEPTPADKLTAVAILLEEAAALVNGGPTTDLRPTRLLKALQLHLTVLLQEEPTSPHAAAGVGRLVEALAGYELPAPTKDQLWQCYAQMGQFAKAEDWLFSLLDDPDAPDDIFERGLAFYVLLSQQSDAALHAGNLPRDEVEAGKRELQARAEQASESGPAG